MLNTGNPVENEAKFDVCPFYDLCKLCHPEEEMVKRREKCDENTKRRCAVYWAFQDGYRGLDDD